MYVLPNKCPVITQCPVSNICQFPNICPIPNQFPIPNICPPKYMSTKNRSQIYVQSQSEFNFFQTAQWWETLCLEVKEMYVEF